MDVRETYTRTAETNEKFQRSYTRTFRVVTDDPHIGPAVVRESVGIAIGETYSTGSEYDDGAYCLNKSASCTSEDGKQWVVTVSYGPPPDPENPNNESPTLQPPEMSWSFDPRQRPIEVDIEGRTICNTVGDPFATAVLRDDSRPVLSVVRNEAFFNAPMAWMLRDTVNSDAFLGAPAGTVKVSNISSQRQFSSEFGFYWKTSYEFTYDADGFDTKLVNAGLRALDDEGNLKNILVQGTPISEPVLLSEQGEQLDPNAPPHILKFKVYNETSFGVFNF